MHFFYLHGFASSPRSSKALFLAERFAVQGVKLHCPDFNEPDFSTLTVSRMLQQLEERISMLPPGDVVLIGSSLGGFVAVEAAACAVNQTKHPVSRLVLLAPALELQWERWSEVGPGGIERWRKAGSIDILHYAADAPKPLRFSFYEDAMRYAPASRRLTIPLQIFQGRRDDSVDPASVARFAAAQPDAQLHLLDDGHQLANSLDLIWRRISESLVPNP
jgi:pimeloyl-ACP methyl ester carboxylesterase